MKTIDTLVDDIYTMLENNGGKDVPDEVFEEFGKNVARVVADSIRYTREPRISMSNFATPDRKMWYAMNKPELAETLRGPTRIKFLLGHMAEQLVILLTEMAGHTVEGKQDVMHITEDFYGSRDCVIDGSLVDVKSASSFGFNKFKYNNLDEVDPFGYLDQLTLYHVASRDDPLVKDKTTAHFLAVNKENGELALSPVLMSTRDSLKDEYIQVFKSKTAMTTNYRMPTRCYEAVHDGKSGNMKLDTECSYCPFKKACWPGLRTFLYSGKPRFLTHVAREPDVTELID